MAAQKGKDLLLKLDETGAGAFETVAGLRSHTLAFNAETVDVTHVESAGRWRELLQGAGLETVPQIRERFERPLGPFRNMIRRLQTPRLNFALRSGPDGDHELHTVETGQPHERGLLIRRHLHAPGLGRGAGGLIHGLRDFQEQRLVRTENIARPGFIAGQ